jgi:hypothetical protein
MEFIFLIPLAIALDGIEIILALTDVGSGGLGLVLHILQIFLDFLFTFLLIIFGFKSLFQKEVAFSRLLIRRILPIFLQGIGEIIPILDFLPIRTLATIFLWLEVSGTLDKIISKIGSIVSSVLSVLPAPLRERVEFLAKRIPIGSMLLRVKEKVEEGKKTQEPQIVSEAKEKKGEGKEEKKKGSEEYRGLFGLGRVISKASGITEITKKITQPTIVSKAKMQPSGLTPILILFIFFPFFAFAQTKDVYFFAKKSNNGTIVSAVFVDKKTKTVYSYPSLSRYEWKLPFSETPEIFSNKPFIKIDLNKRYSSGDFKISLSIKNLINGSLLSSFDGNIYLEKPDVSIIYLKKNYFEIPFVGNPLEKEEITFKAFGFSSNDLTSIWRLNGNFISNDRTLNPYLLSGGFLNLEVRNKQNRSEGAFADAFLR